ncbi:hypothetical protein MHYP_G00148370 [Metynnis hypsauchen]
MCSRQAASQGGPVQARAHQSPSLPQTRMCQRRKSTACVLGMRVREGDLGCGCWSGGISLIQKGTILDMGIYRKICADLRFRMEHDVIRWGYHAAKERWRDLLEL